MSARQREPVRRRLLVLAAMAAVGATAAAVGPLSGWPGAVHLVALPPLDLFADVRVLTARARSYPQFAVGLLASVAVRTLLLTILLGAGRRAVSLALSLYAVALPPALLAAGLTFSGFAALYARLFWPGLVVTVGAALLLSAAPWTAAPGLRAGLWRSWRAGLRLWTLAAYLAALGALGAAAAAAGSRWAVAAAVPLSAVLTGAAIPRLSRPPPEQPLRHAALAVAVAVVAAAAVVRSAGEPPVEREAHRDGSLLIMSGINSASGEGAIFELDPRTIGFRCEQTYYYSYAGPGHGQPRGDAACPIRSGRPYAQEDTQRPLSELVEGFRAQAAGLPAPLVVLGHSQAVWVFWGALATGELDNVAAVVLVGPFPSSPVAYPAAGSDGVGRVGGDWLRAGAAIGEVADFQFDPDAPLARQLLATPDASATLLARPLPSGVRALSAPTVVDLPLMPEGRRIDGTVDACPVRAAHPDLPLASELHRAIGRFLDGLPPRPCPWWRPLVGPAGRPFGPPSAVDGRRRRPPARGRPGAVSASVPLPRLTGDAGPARPGRKEVSWTPTTICRCWPRTRTVASRSTPTAPSGRAAGSGRRAPSSSSCSDCP